MQYQEVVIVWLSLFFGIGIAPCQCFDISSPQTNRRLSIAAKSSIIRSVPVILYAAKDSDETISITTTSLYQPIPSNKPWTFGILTSGFPPQQLLVPIVKFVTFQVWRLMMNELVTHDEQGRFIRESFQAGNNPAPLSQPSSSPDNDDFIPRYKLYLGNPCPWCHRVKAVVTLLELEHDISTTMLIDNAEKASKGGWILPDPTPSDRKHYDLHKELIQGDLAGVYNYCW